MEWRRRTVVRRTLRTIGSCVRLPAPRIAGSRQTYTAQAAACTGSTVRLEFACFAPTGPFRILRGLNDSSSTEHGRPERHTSDRTLERPNEGLPTEHRWARATHLRPQVRSVFLTGARGGGYETRQHLRGRARRSLRFGFAVHNLYLCYPPLPLPS